MSRKLIDTFIFLIVTAGCVLLTLFTSGGNYTSPTTIYNFIFLGIMVFLYLCSLLGGFYRMADIRAYFEVAADRVDATAEGEGEIILDEQVRDLATFRPLRRHFERFLQDIQRSQSGICDIEDYINEDETDSLVHKRVLDMVPDILTSLGILGTFIGLVWGLRSFEPSSYETMTSSVSSLVDGIKVAFLTSIYGLILSLICSYSLRSGYSSMNDALHHFLDRFHARLVPSAELEAQNRLVNNQAEQNELIRSLTAEFSDQVAHGFAASMAPTLDRINTQLGGMMNTISRNQQLFLQDIVDSFVKEMKSSFQTEFSQFGDTLQRMNNMVNTNIQYSEQTYRQMADDMRTVFSQDEAEMRQAVTDLAAIQRDLSQSVSAMTNQYGHMMQTWQEAQENTLKSLSRSEKESARFWVACNQAMQNYLTEAAGAYSNFEKANASSDKVLTAMSSIYQKNEKALEDYQRRLREFQETQKKMNATLEEIHRLFYQLEVAGSDGKNLFLYPGMSRQSKDAEQRMLKELQSIIHASEDRQGEALDEIRQEMKEMNSSRKLKWFSR